MATQGKSMRCSIVKTISRSLAALTIAAAVLGAANPSYADQNGAWVPGSFPTEGVVRLGLSPNGPTPDSFTAYYQSAPGEAKSCSPVVVHHARGDTIDIPAPGNC
jgi:hypothetical protein